MDYTKEIQKKELELKRLKKEIKLLKKLSKVSQRKVKKEEEKPFNYIDDTFKIRNLDVQNLLSHYTLKIVYLTKDKSIRVFEKASFNTHIVKEFFQGKESKNNRRIENNNIVNLIERKDDGELCFRKIYQDNILSLRIVG